MGIKERISNVWQKLKNRFSGQDENEELINFSQALEEAPAEEITEEAVPAEEMPAEEVQPELLEEECPEEQVSRSAEAPEAGEIPTEPIPSRMTDEYKEWLLQQREAADAANNANQGE